jgi:hypothetical protein
MRFASAVVAVVLFASGCATNLGECGRACLKLAQCQTSDAAGADLVGNPIDLGECGNVECDPGTQACILAAADCAGVLACRWPGGTTTDAGETTMVIEL